MLAALLFAHPEAARAADTWTNDLGDNLFERGDNWLSDSVPNAASGALTFDSVGNTPNTTGTVEMNDYAAAVDSLNIVAGTTYSFENTLGTGTAFTLESAGTAISVGEGSDVSFDSGIALILEPSSGTTTTIANDGTLTIDGNILGDLASDMTLVLSADDADDTTTVNGSIQDWSSSELSLDVSGGSGTVVLTGVNTYSGVTTVSDDMTLEITGNGSISGSSVVPDITINDTASLLLDGDAIADDTLSIYLRDSASLAITGDETITALVALSNTSATIDATLTIAGGDTAGGFFAGDITGTGSIDFLETNLATWVLAGTTSLDGGINIYSGGIEVTGNAAATDFLARSTGELVVDYAGVTGNVVLGNAVDASGGGTLTNWGRVASVTLYSSNSVLNAQAGSNVIGTATAQGGGTISANGGSFGDITLLGDPEGTGGGVGTLDISADTNVSNTVYNAGGRIETSAAATLSTTSFSSSSAIDATGGDLTISAADIQLSSGTTILGNLILDGDTTSYVDLTVDYTMSGDLTVQGGTTTLTSTADMDGNGLSVENATVNSDGTLGDVFVDAGGTFNMTSGDAGNVSTVDSGAVATLTTGGTVTSVSANGGGTITLDNAAMSIGELTNNGGTVTLDAGTVTGDLNANSGTTTIGYASDLEQGVVQGTTYANGGTLDSYGTLGQLYVQGSTVNLKSGSTTGNIQVNVAGLTIEAGAQAANVYTVADATNNGTIATLGATNGTFTNTGTIIGGVIFSGGATVDNTGTIGGDSTVTDYGTLNTSGTTADIDVLSTGTLNVTGGTTGHVNNSGTASNTGGTIDSLTNSGGTFDNTSGTIAGNVQVNGGTVNNGGTISGTTVLYGGTLNTSGTTGDIVNGSTVNVTGGTTGDITSDNTVNVSGGTTGTITSDGFVTLTGGTVGALDVHGGLAENQTGGTVSGLTIIRDSGTVVASGGDFGAVTVNGNTTGLGQGIFELAADTTVDGDFNNAGLVVSTGSSAVDLTLTSGNTFTNSGTLDGDSANGGTAAMTITADTIVLEDTSVVTGDVMLSGAVTNNGTQDIGFDLAGDLNVGDGGTSTIVTDVDGNGYDVSTAADGGSGGGTLNIDDNQSLTNVGTLDNDGTTNIGAGSTLEAGVIENDGTINVGAGGTLNGTSNTLNNPGTINVGDGATVSDAGDINNSGTISFAGDGTINADTDNSGDALNNSGLIESSDGGSHTITLGDGTNDVINNTATGVIAIGNTDNFVGTGVTLNNSGDIDMGFLSTLTVSQLTNENGGTITLGGANLLTVTDGDLINEAGGIISNAGGTITSDVVSSGALTSSGIMANVTINDGTFFHGGTVNGTTTINGGAVTNSGTLSGTATLTGGSLTTSGTAAAISNNGGEVYVTGGTTGTITNTTGSVEVSGGTAGDIANSDTLDVLAGGAAGAVTNSGTGTNAGTIASLGNTAGTFDNTGTISGNAVVSGGTLDSDGSVGGDVSVSGTAVATLAGSVDGAVTASGAATVTIDGALSDVDSITQDSSAELEVTGNVTMDAGGTVTNNTDFSITGATFASTGLFTNNDTLELETATLEMDLTNAAGATAEISDSAVIGDIENNGLLSFADGAVVTGNITSAASGSTLSLADGDTTDSLTLTGDLQLGETIAVDVDLSTVTGAADLISVDGDVTQSSSTVIFAFNDLSGGTYSELTSGLDILTYTGTSDLDYSVSGLPTTGAVLYELINDTSAGSYQLQSGANPAIGGLASGLTLTYSLIGSVVNRPSSAFLTGTAYESDDRCNSGAWGRAIGGEADVTGATKTDLGSYETDLDANYQGVQVGFDRSCTEAQIAGWDLSFGGTFGANFGSINQPVYDFNTEDGTLNTAIITSFNNQSFTQLYGGGYVGAAKDNWFADLQLRYESTEFDLSNVAQPGFEGLGVADQTYNTTGVTISGSLGNNIILSREDGVSLVPSVGFSFANQKVDNITFDNGTDDPGDDGVLEIDDIENRIGFASLALTKVSLLESGTEAIRYFGTATVYNDFGAPTVSRYYQQTDSNGNPDPSVDPLISESDNLGAYGEISLGLNYTMLMDTGGAIPARQLDASVRADGRFGENMSGWGLTAQIRLSF